MAFDQVLDRSVNRSTERSSERPGGRCSERPNDPEMLLLGRLLLLLLGKAVPATSRQPAPATFRQLAPAASQQVPFFFSPSPLPPPPTRSCPPSDRPVERTSERAIEQTISCRTVPIDGLVRYREANRIYMDAHTHTYIQTSLHTPVQRAVGPDPPAIPKNKRMACFPRAGARVSQRQCR